MSIYDSQPEKLKLTREVKKASIGSIGTFNELAVGAGTECIILNKQGSKFGGRTFDSANAWIKTDGTYKFKDGSGNTIMDETGIAVGSVSNLISIQGWTFSGTFSSTDADTVEWTSGTITLGDGTTFSIDAGNTGNMVALTYIYFDKTASETVLQTTTTASDAVGANKILMAVAENNTDTGATEAIFQTFGGSGGAMNNSTSIAKKSVTAAKTSIAAINPADGEINANKVGTTQIDALAVTEAKIAASAVTAAKTSIAAINPVDGEINENKVGTTQINSNAVTEAKILASAVTEGKIAALAVTEGKIAASAVTAGKIAAGAITAEKISAGAVTANKITSYNFMMSEGSFTNNSPDAGKLAWTDCKVVYNGTEYEISDDNCLTTDKHIYWQLASPTVFQASASLPSLGNDDFLVAFNNSGTAVMVWNSTVVNGNRITSGSITATNIAAATITATEIASSAITSDKITAGAVTANKITSYNFMLSEGSFTDDSPGAGEVAWTDCKVVYNGTEYEIEDGASDNKHIYWQLSSPEEFQKSNTLPALGNDDFLVAFNDSGNAKLVWNSTVINGNRITAGSIVASNIAAGTITSNEIASTTITASNIAAATITGAKIAAGTISASNIATGTITANEIAANTITASEMNVSTLSSISANIGTITSGTITGATIQTALTGYRAKLTSAQYLAFLYNDTTKGRIGADTGDTILYESLDNHQFYQLNGTYLGELNEDGWTLKSGTAVAWQSGRKFTDKSSHIECDGGFEVKGDCFPDSDNDYECGKSDRRWSKGHFEDLDCDDLYVQDSFDGCGSISGCAYHEVNLLSDEAKEQRKKDLRDGEKETNYTGFAVGDVLCWGADGLKRSEYDTAHCVLAVAGQNGLPVVLGAEPIKVIGKVNINSFLVTSPKEGYARAWTDKNEPPRGCVIAVALERKTNTDPGMVKAMIQKL